VPLPGHTSPNDIGGIAEIGVVLMPLPGHHRPNGIGGREMPDPRHTGLTI